MTRSGGHRTRVLGCAAALSLGWAIAPAAADTAAGDADVASLRTQVQDLQREVAQLRRTDDQHWLDQRRAEDVKALIREVLADADTRASLLQDAVLAGYDNGFFLKSADGNYLLKIMGQIQFRYNADFRDNSGSDDSNSGFELARTRFGFKGHVIDPSWQYFIWTGYGANGNDLLLDAWIKKDFGQGLSLTAGQFKVPFWREWLISETRLQAVERSLINNVFGCNYTQGLTLGYQNDALRGQFSVNDGASSRVSTWNTPDSDYALTARGEWLATGTWKQADELEAWAGDDPLVMLGGAVLYQHGEEGTLDDETDTVRWTADVTAKWNGLSLLAAVLGSHADNGDSVDQFAALLQAGFFVTEKLELFARYEWGDLDTEDDDDLSILTVGGNYFFRKHAVKLSADVGYGFNPVTAGWTGTSGITGWQADSPDEDGQVLVRTQLQLLF